MTDIEIVGSDQLGVVLQRAEQGWKLGEMLTTAYANQPNPQPQYIAGRRVHHGDVGLIGVIATAVIGTLAYASTEDKDTRNLITQGMGFAFGFFGELMWDDREDVGEWLKFREQETYIVPSQNAQWLGAELPGFSEEDKRALGLL